MIKIVTYVRICRTITVVYLKTFFNEIHLNKPGKTTKIVSKDLVSAFNPVSSFYTEG
jgi:hypothetical protein